MARVLRPRRGIRQHRDLVRLDLERAAAHPEQQLFAALGLNPHFAGLQRGEQGRVPRRDTDLAAGGRREHHRGGTRVDLAFGADDVDVDRVRHDQDSVFAFSTASSMPPTM